CARWDYGSSYYTMDYW
nr:immunoglobulin heavy chain junction region [Mus musculus]MBK4187834.1 immunoglobulin heavy chain junction region [Mus musculus]MBK4187835.1 immunoglobulin heavy chain junction region [Mus musculus]MBK4187836.1 immunoglobulin heavy chain junction region [Mus musculus]